MTIATTTPQATWIEQTLKSLTIDQKIGQLLHPNVRVQLSPDEIAEQLDGIEPGGMFVFPGTREEMARCTATIQSLSATPVVISSDLENGAGRMVNDATKFPDLMALAATDDDDLAYTMGSAAAIEGRACGIHWTFAPLVDINANWRNPITNTRGLGDQPERISRLARRLIAGMQDNGLAATAKHFPGDGFDERDQHVMTSVNPLSRDEWRAKSGRMFAEAIADGVWTIMPGHIALPSFDPGTAGGARDTAPPATLSRKLLTELLRGDLGFDGCIVSDASRMGGITSWGPRSEIVPQMVNAGNDMVLFCETKQDFQHLKRAFEDGRLSEERIDDAVRRVLKLKTILGLHETLEPPVCSAEQTAEFQKAAHEIAERAITVASDRNGVLPLDLSAGKRVLSVHFLGDPIYNVDGIDDILRKRGLDVTVYNEQIEKAKDDTGRTWPSDEEIAGYDIILVHVVFGPSWCTNRIRPLGNFLRFIITQIPFESDRVAFISYGTPYLLRDIPRLPALLNAYSPDPITQETVVRILAGELEASGISPVEL